MTREKDLKPVCRWSLDPTWIMPVWNTGCDQSLELVNGGPADHKLSFCGFCGQPLIERKEPA